MARGPCAVQRLAHVFSSASSGQLRRNLCVLACGAMMVTMTTLIVIVIVIGDCVGGEECISRRNTAAMPILTEKIIEWLAPMRCLSYSDP